MMNFDGFLGRILNRFSKDIGMIDDMMPMILCDVLQVTCSILLDMMANLEGLLINANNKN